MNGFIKFFLRISVLKLMAIVLAACTATASLQPSPFPIPSERYTAILVKMDGTVLHSVRPDAVRFPASLTKMMTLYLLFEGLSKRKFTLQSRIPVSANAARKPASKLYLKAGETISVEDAINALAIKSANDVATAVAEYLGGSEATFARIMTAHARSLGMKSTIFRNASGLPDKRQVSTARDMSKLSIALYKKHRRYYGYVGRSSFVFRGRTIRGHNRVLKQLRGADGIKTGYTRASGFNLATSARTSKGRVVGVIMGENSGRTRNAHMVQLFKRFAP